ncbi:hypothetical protein L208DRAFT_1243233, partial [Tricholoma matsutake]
PATDAGRARIPMLQVKDPVMKQVTREATDNKSKGQLFYNMLFPLLDPSFTPLPQDHQYLAPCWTYTNITDEQLHRAIKKMKPYKATRSGTIPNLVLIHAREELIPHLAPLFWATNTLQYYPQEWATTEILVLKKLGKLDYSSPTAWCPIVLLDGMA